MKELTQTEIDQIVELAQDGLIGHMAMDSVTRYIVNDINQRFDTDFSDTWALVEFAVSKGAQIDECGVCGWWYEYLAGVTKHGDAACDECLTDDEYEDD